MTQPLRAAPRPSAASARASSPAPSPQQSALIGACWCLSSATSSESRPSTTSRIVRFQAALRALRVADPAPLATIAASLRYADQAHMCREFTSMAGLVPSQLHGVSSASPNHVTPQVAEP